MRAYIFSLAACLLFAEIIGCKSPSSPTPEVPAVADSIHYIYRYQNGPINEDADQVIYLSNQLFSTIRDKSSNTITIFGAKTIELDAVPLSPGIVNAGIGFDPKVWYYSNYFDTGEIIVTEVKNNTVAGTFTGGSYQTNEHVSGTFHANY